LNPNHLQSRFLIRFHRFVAIAVLALAVCSISSRALAQTPGVQQTEVAPSASEVTPSHEDEAAAEKREHEEYLHSPMVRSIARAVHIEVGTAANLFLFINAGVIILLILIPLARTLPKVFRKRSEKLRADIESARKITQDANARLSAVEAKLSSLDQEIAKFRSEVEQQIIQDEQKSKAALEEESARIVASAEQEIGLAAAQAKRGLRHFAADLAIEQAGKQLVLTPEADGALIRQFVAEAAKGGQN
jgi:F-type H+-transporting ATPase subunit b